MMEGKKISFGFTKTKKIDKPVVVERKEFIECLEEKSIKVIGGEVVEEKPPLVIALKPNTLITAERLKQIAEEVESSVQEPALDNTDKEHKPPDDGPLVENETLDQMAERELLNEAKKERKVDRPALTVAVPTVPILDGQKESTLDDYDAVPVQEFGMAMLRGMGWTASKEQEIKHKQPQLRPKGLGLGADKVVKDNQKKNVSKDKNEDLSIVKNSFVKITTGKYSGCYGKVVSLDEDNGRVMVDIAIKKETVSLSEFMMQAVTKSEFDKQSKVINADSYEEYKKSEQKGSSNKGDREASSSQRSDETKPRRNDEHRSRRDQENSSNGRNKAQERRHRSRSSSVESSRHRKKNTKKYSSNDSLSSMSDSEKRHKKQRPERKRYSSEDSESSDGKYKKDRREKDSPDKRRDIDKKRKGKKKKRDRDRSPNYKKHRK